MSDSMLVKGNDTYFKFEFKIKEHSNVSHQWDPQGQ